MTIIFFLSRTSERADRRPIAKLKKEKNQTMENSSVIGHIFMFWKIYWFIIQSHMKFSTRLGAFADMISFHPDNNVGKGA